MKPRQNNDMTGCISVVYIEIELSWPIGQGAVYEENQTGQRYDQLYRYGLR